MKGREETIESVFTEKLANLRKFFDTEITESGAKEHFDALTAQRVCAELIAMAPLWGLIETGDMKSIIGILEVTHTSTPEEQAQLDQYLLVLKKMDEARQRKLMDYAKYFVKLTRAWTQ